MNPRQSFQPLSLKSKDESKKKQVTDMLFVDDAVAEAALDSYSG